MKFCGTSGICCPPLLQSSAVLKLLEKTRFWGPKNALNFLMLKIYYQRQYNNYDSHVWTHSAFALYLTVSKELFLPLLEIERDMRNFPVPLSSVENIFARCYSQLCANHCTYSWPFACKVRTSFGEIPRSLPPNFGRFRANFILSVSPCRNFYISAHIIVLSTRVGKSWSNCPV